MRVNFLCSADAHKTAFLQYPQQFGLNQGRYFTNLINEEGSLISQFEEPDFLFRRTGKRAAFVTEEFALK